MPTKANYTANYTANRNANRNANCNVCCNYTKLKPLIVSFQNYSVQVFCSYHECTLYYIGSLALSSAPLG